MQVMFEPTRQSEMKYTASPVVWRWYQNVESTNTQPATIRFIGWTSMETPFDVLNDPPSVEECLANIDAIYNDSPMSEEEYAAYQRASSRPAVTENAAFVRASQFINE